MNSMKHLKKLIPLLVLILIMTSCHTTKTVERVEIPVELNSSHSLQKVDTVYLSIFKEKIDSSYVSDSIVTIYKDSMVYVDRWHTEYLYKYINNTDTLWRTKEVEIRDTIEKPVYINTTTTKTVVKNELNFIQKLFFYLGIIALLTSISYILYVNRKKIASFVLKTVI